MTRGQRAVLWVGAVIFGLLTWLHYLAFVEQGERWSGLIVVTILLVAALACAYFAQWDSRRA